MNTSSNAVEVVQAAYAAFGRGDLPGIMELIANNIDWKFTGSKGLPYTGSFRSKEAVAQWFISIPEVDDVQLFEPREFISGGEHVTILGWERTRAQPGGEVFETDWVHVFTVREGRIVRFWGMYDTETSANARK